MWSKLQQICFNTSDRELRDYLSGELIRGGHLSDEELEIVNYVKVLEQLYSCPSYEVAKSLKIEENILHDSRYA